MKSVDWRDVAARVGVTTGALLPYLPLLSLHSVYVTDDGFASDIWNGELPGRVLVGQIVASGQAPVWSSKLCSGLPLTAGEPVGLGLFAYFDAAKALCLFVIACLMVAAHGTFTFARRLGADRAGACLAGLAFASSGYMVTQLKHLGIISTIVWIPWGLFFLDRALAERTSGIGTATSAAQIVRPRERLRDVGWFGLVFAEQVLSGFPQSTYYCGLVYAVWAFVLLAGMRERYLRIQLRWLMGGALLLAVALAGISGAVLLLPLAELGSVSDRHGAASWEFASMLPYSWSDALNFIVPYVNGDVANGTYHAPGFFWENYGYVGLGTFLLALWAVVRSIRVRGVALLFGIGLGAFAMVLGPNTPIYHLAWKYFPGMGHFRFPTRFLFVVDFSLCVLGALGLTLLRPVLTHALRRAAPRVSNLLPAVIVTATALDLFAQQSHQNPFVPASEWLARPAVVAAMGAQTTSARVFSPMHNLFHRLANRAARGWADLDPYRELRETVAPNTGVYWGVSTADCYAGIGPSWFVDVWGDHSRRGLLVPTLVRLSQDTLVAGAQFARVMSGYGVTHVISPLPIRGMEPAEIPNEGPAHLYRVAGSRVRVVSKARFVRDNREAVDVIARSDFDVNAQVVLHVANDAVTTAAVASAAPADSNSVATARILDETSRHLGVEVTAPDGGYLVLADTYYPGWRAEVDGVVIPILRANLALRAVRLPAGAKRVDFWYDAAPFFLGLKLTCGSIVGLLAWLAAGYYFSKKGACAAARGSAVTPAK